MKPHTIPTILLLALAGAEALAGARAQGEKGFYRPRTILPVICAESPVAGGSDKSGLGDILQRFFFK